MQVFSRLAASAVWVATLVGAIVGVTPEVSAGVPDTVQQRHECVQIDHRIYDGTVEYNNLTGKLYITNFKMYNPCKVCQYDFCLAGVLRDEASNPISVFASGRRHIGCDIFNGVRAGFADESYDLPAELKGKVASIEWKVIAQPSDALEDIAEMLKKAVPVAEGVERIRSIFKTENNETKLLVEFLKKRE